jgi:hypothetical protein
VSCFHHLLFQNPKCSTPEYITNTLRSTYTSLSLRTRLFFGLGLMANAALALQFSDQIESALGLVPSKEDEKELKEKLPRVTRVDRV